MTVIIHKFMMFTLCFRSPKSNLWYLWRFLWVRFPTNNTWSSKADQFNRVMDNHFPGETFPGQDLSRTRRFPDKTFPEQSFSRTDVSRTDVSRTISIILNTLECSCSKINDELSCAPCTYDYMLLIIFLVCIITFLSLLCQFVSHLYFT